MSNSELDKIINTAYGDLDDAYNTSVMKEGAPQSMRLWLSEQDIEKLPFVMEAVAA